MPDETMELEGSTLDEARAKIPAGFRVVAEQVSSDGAEKTVSSALGNRDADLAKARKQVPAGAEVTAEEITEPSARPIQVLARDEAGAKAQAARGLHQGERVGRITLTAKGESRLFGLASKPSTYTVEIAHQGRVQIRYRSRARVKATIRRIPATLADVAADVEELRQAALKTGENVAKNANSLNAISALQVIAFLFTWLNNDVARRFNAALDDVQRLAADGAIAGRVSRLSYELPGTVSVEDIPRCIDLFWRGYREALAAIEGLKAALAAPVPRAD